MKLRMTGATLVMSYEAIGWVLRDAPDVPSQCVSVLVGLAEHADKHGRGAYPSAATLATYARKSERQVRYDLALLGDAKLIRPGDQTLVKKYPPNRRPVVYDLAVERTHPASDMQPTAPQEAEPGVQSASGVQSTAPQQPTAPQTGADLQEHEGVQSTAPLGADFLGCNAAQPGVQPTADKPPLNPSVVDEEVQGGSGGDGSAAGRKPRRPRRDLNEGREDVMRLCRHLADRIEQHAAERPPINKKWLDAARLMIDTEHRTEDQIHKAIDWCQDDTFWCDVILSMPNLRKHYRRLRAQATTRANGNGSTPPPGSRPSTADQRLAEIQARKERDRQQREGQPATNVIQGSVISDQ